MLRTGYAFCHLLLAVVLWNRRCYYPHFIDKNTDAKWMAEPKFKPKYVWLKIQFIMVLPHPFVQIAITDWLFLIFKWLKLLTNGCETLSVFSLFPRFCSRFKALQSDWLSKLPFLMEIILSFIIYILKISVMCCTLFWPMWIKHSKQSAVQTKAPAFMELTFW